MSLKISELLASYAATSLTGSEGLPGLQSGNNVGITAAQIKTYALNGGLASLLAVNNSTGTSTIVFANQTATTVPYLNSSKELVSSSVTPTALGYIANLSGDVQTQINTINTQLTALNSGISWKAPCRAATTGNVTLSGLQNIDGVALNADERLLVWQQTTASENGIYLVKGGAWARAVDFNGSGDNIPGARVVILEGTTHADKEFTCTTDDPVTVGTTAITFVTTSSGSYSGTTNRISISGSVIDIDTAYSGQTSITTLGTVSAGTWNAGIIAPAYGGTGVNNGTKTITLGGNLATTGAFDTTFAQQFTGTITLPPGTSTLSTIALSETLLNKTMGSSCVWNGQVISTIYTGAKIMGGVINTAGAIPHGTGTADTVTSTANFTYVSSGLALSSNVNGDYEVRVTNANISGQANFSLYNNNGHVARFLKYGSSKGNYKIFTASTCGFYNQGSGDIAILNDFSSGAILFSAGGSSTYHLSIGLNGYANIASRLYVGGTTSPTEALQTSGNLYFDAIGRGVIVREATNGRLVTATLVGGTVTINNTSVTNNTRILIQRISNSGGNGNFTYTINSGVSFTVTSDDATDASSIFCFLIEKV